MAGRILRSDIDEVRARVNIADVVGEFVTLKSAGIGSMKGLCPFHDERSPSFHVRPQVGYYHCFGCGEGGDVFTFLQKLDHVSFAEAVERLAGQIGYELHYEDGGQPTDHSNRARLLAANEAARLWFAEQLGTEGADAGRRFLGERGFDAAAAQRFGVGYAPQGWDNLGKHLRGLGFSAEELSTAGLTSTGERGSYDRFRGRLIWPIRDQTGQTVGFGARRLYDDDKGPKYLNTPETPVYHKSQVLYGLDLAKRDIARSRQVVIVEGYTDVMACHLAGVTTAVATCGTSFGVEHIKVMRRIMGDDTSGLGEVVFTFDPDAAGQKAAMRAFSEEQRFAAQTYVAVAPDGLDPCDLRLNRGDDAVRRLISSKKPMFEFVIKQKLSLYNLNTVEGRAGALRDAAPVVADIRDPALRPGYTRELARLLGIDIGDVSRAVDASHTSSGGLASGSAKPIHAASAPGDLIAPGSALPTVSMMSLPDSTPVRQERDALMAMLQCPTLIGRDLLIRACEVGYNNEALAVVRDAIAQHVEQFESAEWVNIIAEAVPPRYKSLVEQLAVVRMPVMPGRALQEYSRSITTTLVERQLVRRKQEVVAQLQRTDDASARRQVQQELLHLDEQIRALRAS